MTEVKVGLFWDWNDIKTWLEVTNRSIESPSAYQKGMSLNPLGLGLHVITQFFKRRLL